ncbi:PEPKR2, partial [Symbiodinium necroappetens]
TLDEAEKRVKAVREDLNFEKLWNMSFEERWLLAQGLGPAFPISLILSYTIYWTANVPFIAYAYYTTVLTGTATMGLVMAGAYTASIPFKPLIYIGGILLTPWVADNVMPLIGKALNMFRLPDEEELNKGLGV